MWAATLRSLSGNGDGGSSTMDDDNHNGTISFSTTINEEELHRKRVTQLLRYLATMHQNTTNNNGSSSSSNVSFVRNNSVTGRNYGPFLRRLNAHEDDPLLMEDCEEDGASGNGGGNSGGGQILFTIFEFQNMAKLMASSGSSSSTMAATTASSSSSPSLPFSFYTARSGSSNTTAAGRGKNTFSHSLLGTGRRSSNNNNSNSNSNSNNMDSSSSSCWLRLTRWTGTDVPSPPPLSPKVMTFLQSWLQDDRLLSRNLSSSSLSLTDDIYQLLEQCLPLERLISTLGPTPSAITQASPKIQRWYRNYYSYRQLLALQRQIEPLYNHLFEWYHQNNDDHLDLIWGLGQAKLTSGNTIIDGPLLQVRVEVELARDGALLVRPKEHAGVTLNRQVLAAISTVGSTSTTTTNGGGGSTSTLDELDMASVTTNNTKVSSNMVESSSIRQLRQLVEGLNASDLSPGQPQTYVPLLKRMAVEWSAGGTFVSCGNTKKQKVAAMSKRGQLIVTDAWCVYSSPRPSAVWARDAWTFAERLLSSNNQTSNTLPRALKALTLGPGSLDETKNTTKDSNDSNGNGGISSFLGSWNWWPATTKAISTITDQNDKTTNQEATVLSRPPFPLPTSDAQNRIADLLLTRNYPAVVCEGPPGTGKTHTIANIVCAYLCQGKRVLVTSKGAPALSVLRERLPDCVQELCVDVSKSESSGMRQLQQTVERLANKVAWVNTERELHKSDAVQENIKELEDELRTIDDRLGSNAEDKREVIQTQQGRDLFEMALELIESAPWLMKTISTWDVSKVQDLYTTLQALVITPNDPMALVDGFDSPPSDALISLAASKAGLALSYLKNATKDVFAKVPLLGSRMAEHCGQVQEQLDQIIINGMPPGETNKKDWYLVFQRLKREKAIHMVCQERLEPLFTRENWPRKAVIHMVDDKKRIREDAIPVLEKAAKMRQITEELELSSSKLDEALEMERLDKRRAGLSSRIQTLAEDLVAARVVAELSKNFSAEAQSALVKFAQVSGKAKFGKSSQASKMTQRQRRKRQEYLQAFEKCVRYIPCWILTSSQISDYLPSECLFDLVVIDEASQSDVTVLPGMLRGKQWLIVGDGKQVSPTESFVAEEQIEMLKSAMPESPFEASMLPGHSFFDLCAQAFPMGRIILREHFRCAPEIISYSNLEFYNGNLVPLRLPTSKERLKPSLIDLRLPNGRKTGKINEQECNEIVSHIGDYVDSCTLLKKRSIGVISLVGEEQSRLIRNRLLDRVGPHKYKLHNILVGEPPSFQGAERDIVYLSMVCSPGSVVTQNQLMHAQRVNVALSRARDRMLLVRSIDMNHIPNEQDVKFSVLDFFERAKYAEENAQLPGAIMDVEEDDDNDEEDHMPWPTMSTFRSRAERLLVKLLQGEGFSTLSMGIVWDNAICVEDARGNGRRAAIAIEAAGETQEEWKAMLEQQKSIERVGWKCMRVDAVSFLANHNDVLGGIVKFLASVMVFPRPKPAVAVAPNVMDQDEHGEENDEVVPNQAPAAPIPVAAQAPAQVQQEEDEIVVVSSDEENEDGNDNNVGNVADLKPAAKPDPPIKQEQNLEDMDCLGNGEKAADYGNVADLGFLGSSTREKQQQRYYSDDDNDDDDDDDDDDNGAAGNPIRPVQLERSEVVPPTRKRVRREPQPVLDIQENDDEVLESHNVSPVARARVLQAAPRAVRASNRPKRGGRPVHSTTIPHRKNRRHRSKSPQKEYVDEDNDDDDLQEKEKAVRESTKRTFVNDDLSVTSSSVSSQQIGTLDNVIVGTGVAGAAGAARGGGGTTSTFPTTASRTSKSSKRRKLDKYARDPKWYQKRSEQQDDIPHADYMEEVQVDPTTMDLDTTTNRNHDKGDDKVDDDDNGSAKDQERYEAELDEAQNDDDDESYRDEEEDHTHDNNNNNNNNDNDDDDESVDV